MNIRAIIFDIYGTLLEIGPPPADAAARWELLWQDMLADPARVSLEDFAAVCASIIEREHATARERGMAHPEVFWPDVAKEALPELARLKESARDEFLFRQAQLWHTVQLAPNAGKVLVQLHKLKVPLGLASNAQPYTLRELNAALGKISLTRNIFPTRLCFYSFQHGFSKPDPRVFRWLGEHLQVLGILPAETLMVGDLLENDITPAQSAGWQTWHLTTLPSIGDACAGNWDELSKFLSEQMLT
ncbi:MAG: HAD family hydrolase [Verrucomicrobia bacterium]|nr:HAD family hydrolase [Verrucomicrobiota bacterium]